MSKPVSSREVRAAFLDFFVEKGHLRIQDASLVPRDDPTLLFINSGMAPLKKYFTGEERPSRPDLCNVQPCIRTTDIDDVGDRHHLTFFEMLGSWSIDNYFKERAIELAFELLTVRLGFDPSRLYATVFAGDPAQGLAPDEVSAGVWERVGMPRDHIVGLGLDNFWGPAGDFGPCGPCTEVFIDTGDAFGPAYVPGGEFDTTRRYIEIWNAGVFMEFDKRPDGSFVKLPFTSVDTGSGLERLTLALAGDATVYDTDLLRPIMEVIRSEVDPATQDPQLRLLTDHIRASTVILSEGVRPSNEGRGYIPRRLIRKAIAVAHRAGAPQYDFENAIEVVVSTFRDFYPRLGERHDDIVQLFRAERADFQRVVARGLGRLETMYSTPPFRISGHDAFHLFATYGLPLEIVRDFARERGGEVDVEGFEAEFRGHQEVSKVISGSHGGAVEGWPSNDARFAAAGELPPTRFTGYQDTSGEATILALLVEGDVVGEVTAPQRCEVVLDATPFYGEGGGQVGDTGVLVGTDGELTVLDTQKSTQGLHVHRCTVSDGTLRTGDRVTAQVDVERRAQIMRNHSATHLLHATLRAMLGDHVRQAGSLVEPARLRFDFEHGAALTRDQLYEVERVLNRHIFADLLRRTDEMEYDAAISAGAIAFFGDTYGEHVRVVHFDGVSTELCGGVHVDSSSEINLFRILSEGSVGAGIRRITAVTGPAAVDYTLHRDALLSGLAQQLGVGVESIQDRVEKLREAAARKPAATRPAVGAAALATRARTLEDGTPFLAEPSDVPAADLRTVAFEAADAIGGVVVLASTEGGKASVVVVVPPALQSRWDAGRILRELLSHVEGRGGGKPHFAQGGGPATAGVAPLLAAVPSALSSAGVSPAG